MSPLVIWKWAGKDGSETYNQFHAEGLIEAELSDSEKLGDLDESTITDTWIESTKDKTESRPMDPNEKPPLSTLVNLDDFDLADWFNFDASAIFDE